MRLLAAILAAGVLATPALSASLSQCADSAAGSVGAIAEPLGNNTRTYAKGQIRVVLMNTGGEPACCAAHIAVIHPDTDGYSLCTLVSDRIGPEGWMSVGFGGKTTYDAATGLTIPFKVKRYVDGSGSETAETLELLVNQSTGEVTVK
ncbi:hypothetical protein [Chachezhania antarctica]|uniref:hypothetical protein n=1 Tax=Chachezhania antarctica TaxID=2340860 RepID=UPI000EADAE80|nr:hypothetical protein [Chachezhania antarctica]|tara:strand:+ start:2965 stop:3408 length:444 start_codon:yes stop_codon:yes gene_type:complete